jgi:glycosyltransferase involved in cell wall biosynthesis
LSLTNKIFYITESDFTKEFASTRRVLNNALSISATNKFEVTIIGYGDTSHTIKNNILIKNVKRGKGNFRKVLYYIFRGFSIVNMLHKESYQPDIVIYYGTHCRILLPLLVYCYKNNIRLISDIVEWSDYSHLPMGRFGFFALDMHIAITILIPKCDGIIAVSSFLENYYRKSGKKTIRIPVTVDTSEIHAFSEFNSPFDSKYLNLIYAGIPGKKDLLLNVIEAVQQLNEENIAVKLHLLGPDPLTIEKEYPCLNYDDIIFYGRVPHDQIALYLHHADFSVLLRPEKRYAQAGFPTKFVESLNAGLPVIANYTSDLPMYLKDGINGFVVNNSTTDALKSILRKISKIQKSQFEVMSYNALETARLNFDYRLYAKVLNEFLTEILNSSKHKVLN